MTNVLSSCSTLTPLENADGMPHQHLDSAISKQVGCSSRRPSDGLAMVCTTFGRVEALGSTPAD